MMIATVIKLDNIAHYFCTHEVRLKKASFFFYSFTMSKCMGMGKTCLFIIPTNTGKSDENPCGACLVECL